MPEQAAQWTVPASFAQERLWLGSQLDPASPVYNLIYAISLPAGLSAGQIGAALAEVVRRHESLRTGFRPVDGVLHQVVHSQVPVELAHLDLSELDAAARQRRFDEVQDADAARPIALDGDRLWRARLIRYDATGWRLMFAVHHTVFDAGSLPVLRDELTELCRAALAQRAPRLPELSIQYADYSVWQREQLAGDDGAELLAYWQARLAGAPPVHALATDRPRPAVPGYAGDEVVFELPDGLTDRVDALAGRLRTTPFVVLLAAYATLVGRLGDEPDVLIGVPVSGRDRPELTPLIGMFVNRLVVRADVSTGQSFADLVGALRGNVLDDFDHQDMPFQVLVEHLVGRRDASVGPLAQLSFNYLPDTGIGSSYGSAADDLNLELSRDAGRLEYSTALYDAGTVRTLAQRYVRLLDAAVRAPQLSLAELPLLTGPEREELLEARNHTAAPLPQRGVLEAFAQQVAATPDAVAVCASAGELSYRELSERAGRIARALRRAGVSRGGLVGVLIPRSAELPAVLLGVWLAGAAYVPLDPAYPPARLRFLLADAGLTVLLSSGSPAVDPADVPVVRLEQALAAGGEADDTVTPVPATLADRAYVIYTSGSTGRPKGVVVGHRAVANLLATFAGQLGSGPGHRWLSLTSLSFDIAALELFLPLTTGGQVVVSEEPDALDGAALLRLVRDRGVTHLQATPSHWRLLVDAGLSAPQLTGLAGGEELPVPLARELRARLGRLINVYGPTETTIWSTSWSVPEAVETVAIGRPVANTQVYVLGQGLEPMPAGAPGELYIGGAGLAEGYLDRPKLTAQRFVPDPFGAPGARLYRTGDRVRWSAAGQLEFLGRVDNQVKVRGHRIEPGEIESVLRDRPGVGDAVVVLREDSPGDQRLVGYLVPDAAADPASLAGRCAEQLRGLLPAHLVPSALVTLPALPLTPNGKLDRAALPAPLDSGAGEHVAPRTAAEELVAEVWREVLGRERVGALDDFFALGGHSLLAVKVVGRLADTIDTEVPVHLMLRGPTVAALAAEIERLLAAEIDELSEEEAQRLLAEDAAEGRAQ